jgi:hypothetical protein
MKIRYIIIAILGMVLISCANQQPNLSDVKAVPTRRISDASLLKPGKGKSEVRFTRDTGGVGCFANIRLWVDGTEVAALKGSEALSVYLQPRIHTFAILDQTPIFGSLQNKSEIEVDVKPARTNKIRLGYRNDGMLILEPTTY